MDVVSARQAPCSPTCTPTQGGRATSVNIVANPSDRSHSSKYTCSGMKISETTSAIYAVKPSSVKVRILREVVF